MHAAQTDSGGYAKGYVFLEHRLWILLHSTAMQTEFVCGILARSDWCTFQTVTPFLINLIQLDHVDAALAQIHHLLVAFTRILQLVPDTASFIK